MSEQTPSRAELDAEAHAELALHRAVLAEMAARGVAEEVLEQQRQWREANPDPGEIGFRAVSPLFVQRNPNLANLYLQISRINPPRHDPAGGQPGGPGAADLSQLTVPTLFFVGEDDQISPPQVIEAGAKAIPGSRVLKVPEAGHSVYFEKPDIFNFEVLRFIESAAITASAAAEAGVADDN